MLVEDGNVHFYLCNYEGIYVYAGRRSFIYSFIHSLLHSFTGL